MARSWRKFLLFVQDLAQQAAVHPFQNHVAPAAILVTEDLHDAGVIEFLADFFFPVKAVEENRVSFHFRMRNFDRNGPAVAQVRTAKNGGHAASGGQAIDAVVIECVAGMESTHCEEQASRHAIVGQIRVSTVCRAVRDTYPCVRRPGRGLIER